MYLISNAVTGAGDLRHSKFLKHPYKYTQLTRFYYREEPFLIPQSQR